MSNTTSSPVTTFILLKSHEPACPPSITDAGSQAGQAFNQVLRYIAGCPGFQSQLFGWPTEATSDDIDLNEWMASIMPGLLGIFINWDDDRTANNFLSLASMAQAFQGITAFFEIPEASITGPIRALNEPVALNITWESGDAAKILNRTKLPLQVCVAGAVSDLNDSARTESDDNDMPDAIGAARANMDIENETFVRIRHLLSEDSNTATRQTSASLILSLMRTRYCSRLKEDLYDMIRARRVD